jgi:RNA polymerase sigma-70 factor, ECF subfamily
MDYSMTHEHDIIFRAQCGDAKTFDRLVSLHGLHVYRLAYRILGSAEDAADARQEAFLLAWLNLQRFECHAAFSTWLHRIVVNLCLSWKRRKVRTEVQMPLDEDALGDWRSVWSQQRSSCADEAIMVRQALSSIPERQRTLLILKEVEGWTCNEISHITGSSSTGVRARLTKARKALRQQFVALTDD